MDTSTIISLAALLVSMLALPTSYFVARRQVMLGLDERERRERVRARDRVANSIDEFFNVFASAAYEAVGIPPNQLEGRQNELEPHWPKIDEFVVKAEILQRLATAIDILLSTAPEGLPEDTLMRLKSMRGLIALGWSDATRSTTRGIISLCDGDILQATLRKT
jgi:hypothetical protein